MRQYAAVTRVQLWGLLASVANSNTRRSRAWSAWLVLALVGGIALLVSAAYSFGLAAALATTGDSDLVLVLMPAAALLVAVLLGSQGAGMFVFAGKDNDLLLSLPIPRVTLGLAKLTALLVQNLLLTACMVLPAGAAHAVFAATGPWFWPALLADAVFLALLGTAVSVLLGLVVALVVNLRRGTALVNVAGMVALVALVVASLLGQAPLVELLATDPSRARTLLEAWLPVLVWARDVAVVGSPVSLGLLAGVTLAPFVAVAALVGRQFVAITTRVGTPRGSVARAPIAAMRSRTPLVALVRREGQRFFGSTVYFLNTGIGFVLLLLGAGYLAVTRSLPEPFALAASVLGVPPALLLAVAAAGVLSAATTTAPSVSLEGQRLWIVREAPLASSTVLEAKVAFNMVLVAPTVAVFAVAAALATGPGPGEAVLLVALPLCSSAVLAQLGLLLNLLWPNLTAPNDTVVVKQSAAVVATLFGGMVLVAASAAGGLALAPALGAAASFGLVTLVLAALAFALRPVVRGWGVRRFEALV